MPRLLILRSSLRLGGVERQLLDHTRRLSEAGWRVDLVCFLRGEGEHPLVAVARKKGIPAVTVPDPGPLHPRAWLWLRAHLRHERPEIIHTCDYRSDVLACLTARGVPWAAESHGHTQPNRAMRLWNACDHAALRRADAVVCVSAAWETQLAAAGVTAQRLHVAGNTTAILLPDPPPPQAKLPPGLHLLFAGRRSAEKGLDWLLTAWPHLRSRFPDLHLWAAGEGQRPPNADAIHWLGYQPDIRPWLLAVDAVIVPSQREAWGMTAFESLVHGVPVLAARTGGLPQLCAQAPHAWLFTPGSIPSLVDGLQEVLNPAFPRGPGVGLAYRSQPRFDPVLRFEQWQLLYDQLLHSRPSPSVP